MIKAIFFDIDGTLVSFKTHVIPENTRRTLELLKQKGIKMFIATGRSEMLVDNIDKDFFDGILTMNGQYVRDKEGVIYKNAIPKSDIAFAIDYVEKNNVSCLFEGEDFMVTNELNENAKESVKLLDLNYPEPSDIRKIADKDIIQLIFYGDEKQEKEIMAGMPSCETTRWSPLLVDIIPKGGGKHVGIEKALEHYGFTRDEVMAFGDGDNDASMLKYCGTGVAMGNAADSVKAVADYITTSVDDDGISNALRHFGVI